MKKKSKVNEINTPICDEIKKKLDNDDTIVKLLPSEGSISEDLKKYKPVGKVVTENGFDSILKDVMNNFNNYINKENEKLIDMTRNQVEVDNDPNIFIKLTPSNENERVMFKDRLIMSGEKKRPIHLTIGDYDFFYEYIDVDNQPVFSFNKKYFNSFFSNKIEDLKSYIEKNKCYFSGITRYSDRISKFSQFIVEIIDKKKKPVKKEEETVKVQDDKSIVKKVYKVKFFNDDPLFILTDNPSNIFQQYNEKIDSIKVLGCGVDI